MGDKFAWKAGDLQPVDTGRRRFDGPRTGTGRWAEIVGVGTLWTNDRGGTGLGPVHGDVDHDRADELVHLLLAYAEHGLTASAAFDQAVTTDDYGHPIVHTTDRLERLFDWLPY